MTLLFQGLRLKEALAKCKELQENITDLETKLEMTSEKSALIDPTRHESLVAASESDKVAASRAMKQNQQLKVQVEELENAILQLVLSFFLFSSVDSIGIIMMHSFRQTAKLN